MNNEEFVTITSAEYEDLLRADKFLTALENAGVDNWDGYDFALELFQEEEGA